MSQTATLVPVMSDVVPGPLGASLLLRGMSEPGSSVTIYDNNNLVGTVVADANGDWALKTASSGGVHSYTETATDTAGNAGASAGVTLFGSSAHQLVGGTADDVLVDGPRIG